MAPHGQKISVRALLDPSNLGAEVYPAVIQEGLKIGSADSPVAQATKLSWVLTGPTSVDESFKPKGLVHGLPTSVEPTLSEVLSKFWQIDVPFIPLLSPEDQRCEDHYSKTVSLSSTVSICKILD